ncbi:hypothetical protein [Streptomyces sp. NPDC059398]|uniref:hypothetical protein n=1 Tax=Streptomyces sp. NPDC059398 TaxID=3346820 RepID=UPI0036B0619A
MADISGTTAAPANVEDPRVQEAFNNAKKYIALYGVISLVCLGTVAGLAITGHDTSSFMWVRAAILLIVAPLLYRLATRSAQGDARNYDRLATVTVILPIAIVVVDLIPGLCPVWYAVIQGLSALALVGAAVIIRASTVSVLFPKPAKKKKQQKTA